MAQVAQQLTVGIEDAMNDMMKKVGTNMQKNAAAGHDADYVEHDDCDDAGDESAWKRNGARRLRLIRMHLQRRSI